jgi:hypothetical protein
LAFDLVAFIINLIVSTIILAPVLWLAGRALVGKKKAKFTDAIMIVVIGIVVGAIFGAFVPNGGIIGSIVQLIIWLYLVKHFFECGWLKALVISIVAIIIFVIIATVLGLFGYALMKYV